jgi:hypothetical protein
MRDSIRSDLGGLEVESVRIGMSTLHKLQSEGRGKNDVFQVGEKALTVVRYRHLHAESDELEDLFEIKYFGEYDGGLSGKESNHLELPFR